MVLAGPPDVLVETTTTIQVFMSVKGGTGECLSPATGAAVALSTKSARLWI